MQIHMTYSVDPCNNVLIDLPVANLQFRPNLMMMLVKVRVSYREGTEALCVLSSEPESWPHAWHGWCLKRSFRAHFRAGNLPSCSQLLLSAFMSLPLPISFSFIWNPSLSILSPSLSLSLCLTLYYSSLSNHVIWHFSSAFSLSIFSSLFSFCFSSFSLFVPLSWSVSPFLFFSVLISLSPTWSSPLCDIARAAHTHSHSHMHTITQSHTGTPWLRLAGLFELYGDALRDCVWLCMWHVCVCTCSWECVHVCTYDTECLQKCEIEDMRQLHLSWDWL